MKPKFAALQLNAINNVNTNLDTVLKLCQKSVDAGWPWVVLPEVYNYRRQTEGDAAHHESIPGPSTEPLMAFAKKHKIVIIAGSLRETIPNSSKSYNTSVIIGADGEIKARYRKIHLFDIQLPDTKVMESKDFEAGRDWVVADIDGIKVGLSICYDLRFPELYRKMSQAGAEVIVVPSSFTYKTGKDHWEVLLKARAIENQCFIIAPNQIGHRLGVPTFGHSMIVDPWGDILAKGNGQDEGVISATLDFDYLRTLRAHFPVLEHRKF